MGEIIQGRGVATDDLRLLAVVQQMLQTARSEPAKRAFELFLRQEKQRLDAGRRELNSTEGITL